MKPHLYLILLILLVTSSCGSITPHQPKQYEDLAELSQKAHLAYEQKEYDRALKLYAEALRISRSLDNSKSTTLNLINMAVIHHKLKNQKTAHTLLDEALALEGVPSEFISEAQFQKALLNLDIGKPEAAHSWAEKSLASCKSSAECESSLGARWNLLGRVVLLQGKDAEAWGFAAKGYDLSKKYEAPAEEANAYRLMAEIKLKQKDRQAAKDLYNKALTIDKELGQSRKILLDLKGLAEVYAEEGNAPEAAKYYQRAYEAAKNSGEPEAAEEISLRIKKIRGPSAP